MAVGILLPFLLCCLRQEESAKDQSCSVFYFLILIDSEAYRQRGLGDYSTQLLILWIRKRDGPKVTQQVTGKAGHIPGAVIPRTGWSHHARSHHQVQ